MSSFRPVASCGPWRRRLATWRVLVSGLALAAGAALVPSAIAETVYAGQDARAWPINLWRADDSRPVVVHDSGTYNHQPVVVTDLDGSYLVLWVGHPEARQEGAKGQLVYASRSRDQGRTWSPRAPLFNAAAQLRLPAEATSEWQPRVARVRLGDREQVWVAFGLGRGSAAQGAVLARETQAGGGFALARLVYDDATRRVVESPFGVRVDAGRSVLWTVEGRRWFPYPQAIMQRRDGTVLVTLTLIEPDKPFTAAEKRFAVLRQDGEGFVLSSLAPVGELAPTDVWESDLRERADGGLVAYIRSNDIGRPRGYRQATSESTDGGRSWSPVRWARLAVHTEQPSIAAIDDQHAVLTVPDNTIHRNNRALLLLSDTGVTYGLGFSEEADGKAFAHTSAVSRDGQRLLAVWSQGPVGGVPNTIWFRRIDTLPERGALNLILRRNAAYELDDARQVATWNGSRHELVLQGQASAGLEVPTGRNLLRLTARAGSLTQGVVIGTVGNYLHHMLFQWNPSARGVDVVEVRRTGADLVLVPRGTAPVALSDGEATLSVFVDAQDGTLLVGGTRLSVERPLSFFFGDGFLTGPAGLRQQVGFDLSAGVAFRCPETARTLESCVPPKAAGALHPAASEPGPVPMAVPAAPVPPQTRPATPPLEAQMPPASAVRSVRRPPTGRHRETSER